VGVLVADDSFEPPTHQIRQLIARAFGVKYSRLPVRQNWAPLVAAEQVSDLLLRPLKVALSTSAAHSGLMNVWSDAEWLTLQLGPVWVTSALLGRSHFDDLEQEAFWRAVEDAPIGESALPWQLMQAIRRNQDWLLDEFILDDRSIITGLSQVTSLLERVPMDISRETRQAILRVGSGMALARGPFGRRITEHDAQVLELLAQLLESTAETVENNPLNSDVAL
jgi:hypothetical protein